MTHCKRCNSLLDKYDINGICKDCSIQKTRFKCSECVPACWLETDNINDMQDPTACPWNIDEPNWKIIRGK